MGTANISKPHLHLPPVPPGYKSFKIWAATALRRIAQAAGISLQIDGAESGSAGLNGALRFKISPGGTGETGTDNCLYAWTPTFIRNSSGNDIVTLEPGSISGATVKIGGDSLLDFPRPELSIPDDADTSQIVYLKLNSVNETTGYGFVTGGTIGSAEIKVSSTELSSTVGTSSTLYLELFRWRNGALEGQLTKYNVGLYMRGISGSATVSFPYQGALA